MLTGSGRQSRSMAILDATLAQTSVEGCACAQRPEIIAVGVDELRGVQDETSDAGVGWAAIDVVSAVRSLTENDSEASL